MKIVAEKRPAASHTLVPYAGSSELTHSAWSGILWPTSALFTKIRAARQLAGYAFLRLFTRKLSGTAPRRHPSHNSLAGRTPDGTVLAKNLQGRRHRFTKPAVKLGRVRTKPSGAPLRRTAGGGCPYITRKTNGQRLNRRWPLYSPGQILFALMLVLWRRA